MDNKLKYYHNVTFDAVLSEAEVRNMAAFAESTVCTLCFTEDSSTLDGRRVFPFMLYCDCISVMEKYKHSALTFLRKSCHYNTCSKRRRCSTEIFYGSRGSESLKQTAHIKWEL